MKISSQNKIIKLKTLNTIFIIAILTILLACDKKNDSNDPADNPLFSVKLTDAPSGYDAVNVEILYLNANLDNGWVEFPAEAQAHLVAPYPAHNAALYAGDTNLITSPEMKGRIGGYAEAACADIHKGALVQRSRFIDEARHLLFLEAQV